MKLYSQVIFEILGYLESLILWVFSLLRMVISEFLMFGYRLLMLFIFSIVFVIVQSFIFEASISLLDTFENLKLF